MKWGYSGYTKSQTRRLLRDYKEKEITKLECECLTEEDTEKIINQIMKPVSEEVNQLNQLALRVLHKVTGKTKF